MNLQENKTTGNWGEERASEYLEGLGWKILGRNINYPFGEIDILAEDLRKFVVIVEVKTVRGSGWGSAADLVRRQKQHKLRLLAGAISKEYPGRNLRIDVVAIDGEGIDHIENAVEGT
ncbi:MAG: YraN family protein [Candidatus Berkelbacteria bacterium]|nr:YraN family protein [Candidatus Berkelbacteria bacterium]